MTKPAYRSVNQAANSANRHHCFAKRPHVIGTPRLIKWRLWPALVTEYGTKLQHAPDLQGFPQMLEQAALSPTQRLLELRRHWLPTKTESFA